MIKEYIDSLKIEDIPWDRMATAYGTAKKYPQYLDVLDKMQDIRKMSKAFDKMDFEHQSTMFPPAPFALVFLTRILEKARQTDTPEAEWIIEKFSKAFDYYLEICADADSMEHDEQLPEFSDMLDEKYLLPKNCTEDDLDDFFENPDSMPDNYFYSLYYYSGVVLAEIPDMEDDETYRKEFGLEEYTEDIIKKVISSAMKGSSIPITDTAKELNISENDVRNILSSTSQVWNH